MGNVTPLIKTEGIYKRFTGTQALSNVSFELLPGEVHALMGENGAGKSTLAKIIAAIYPQDQGEIYAEGKLVKYINPKQAMEGGISIVLQEFNLFPDLSVAENIFIVDEQLYSRGVLSDKKEMVRKTMELLDLFNLRKFINPLDKISKLSVAEMQIIEILKAVSTKANIIILDEPTAALSQNEVARLFEIVRDLKSKGVGFIIVSHRINEIYQIADRITVLRDGKLILEGVDIAGVTEDALVQAMVGRKITDIYSSQKERKQAREDKVMLEVTGICDNRNYVKNVSFSVKSGEIVGISGLVGAGRSELVRCIFGIDERSAGNVKVNGRDIKKNSIRDCIRAKMAFVPENRKEEGLLQEMKVVHNVSLSFHVLSRHEYISSKGENKRCVDIVSKLGIKGNTNNLVRSLSGGNQQKVLLAKWLILNPEVLIVDEPTRGIDIAAKSDIYAIIKNLAAEGIAIIIVSSEIPEILGVADRILIMKDGQMVKELKRSEATEELVGYYSTLGTGIQTQ